MFLACPVAAAVTQWAASLWVVCTGDTPPPVTAPVFLAGDRSEWDPGGGVQGLIAWTAFRCAVLYFLWQARSIITAQPASIAARIIDHLQCLIRADHARVCVPVTSYARVAGSWLPKRNPLKREHFQGRWTRGQGFCTLTGDHLGVTLSVTHPIPLPAPIGN